MAGKLIVVLLMLVPLLGGLNYVRNEPLDKDLKNRTYAGVSDADLHALHQAYEQRVGYVKTQVDDAPEGRDLVDRYGSSDVGGKAEGFASFQERNRKWRDQRGKVFEEQGTLKEIQREISIRARGLHTEWGRILRRVKTL